MSVPYETACEPAESPETPEEHLARLLGRALNSFELSDEVLERLDTALAYDGSLHSAHHSAGLHRITYRHTWLLADGSAVTLWELVHNTGPTSAPGAPEAPRTEQPGRHEQHELYTDEEEMRAAVARLPLPVDEPVGLDLPVTMPSPPVPLPRHAYVQDNSADHARRLLRRAENADRPGLDTLRLLGTAFAHQITQAFGRPSPAGEARLGYALYEHAFLLADGREISLWEVEHTATPDGRHMCEVYTSESAARGAMAQRASRTT
ncbi:hypothetical protein GCM10018793_34750 [Streptomyces sulfonofaciens]|uniref:Uncharacterized protein n=1 Tax=Streptomyces sulfonofaciens TaxID=68272 RepID=A0A919G981_9ACTN|nr:DUF6227 family protein [Streptomyces sulfonofaciens]GHH80196.1 hypothetical protein GCM10018793_34750 [Streptomyces sulfonofaciens]